MKVFVLLVGTLLALDLIYFFITWSLPPWGTDPDEWWKHAWNLSISGGIAAGLTLLLTVKAIAARRELL